MAVGCMDSLEDDRNWKIFMTLRVDSCHMLVEVQPLKKHTVITCQQLTDGQNGPQSWLDHQMTMGCLRQVGHSHLLQSSGSYQSRIKKLAQQRLEAHSDMYLELL